MLVIEFIRLLRIDHWYVPGSFTLGSKHQPEITTPTSEWSQFILPNDMVTGVPRPFVRVLQRAVPLPKILRLPVCKRCAVLFTDELTVTIDYQKTVMKVHADIFRNASSLSVSVAFSSEALTTVLRLKHESNY